MWLGLVRAQGLIGNEVTAILANFENEFGRRFAGLPGYIAAAGGQNVARGAAVSLTLWETEEAVHQADDLYENARDQFARDFGGGEPYVNYALEVRCSREILALEGGPIPPFIHMANYTRVSQEDATSAVRQYTERITSNFGGARGAEGAVLAADEARGEVMMLSFWSGDRELRAARDAYKITAGSGLPHVDTYEMPFSRDLHRVPSVGPVSA